MASRKQNPDKMTWLIMAGIAAAGVAVYVGYKRSQHDEDILGMPGQPNQDPIIGGMTAAIQPKGLVLSPTVRKGMLANDLRRF